MVWTTLIAAAVVATIQPQAIYIETPSGNAEAIFASDVADIPARIASACMDQQWDVLSSESSQTVCAYPNDNPFVVLTMPRYASQPKGILRFVIVRIGDKTRVQASDQIEYQTAFGQTRTGSGTHRTHAQAILIAVGGTYPDGTKFEGFDLKFMGNYTDGGILVASTTPGSSFEPGDLIKKVNGRGFSDAQSFRGKVNKVAAGATLQFTVNRAAQMLTIPVIAEPAR